jgi:hypothetical protein
MESSKRSSDGECPGARVSSRPWAAGSIRAEDNGGSITSNSAAGSAGCAQPASDFTNANADSGCVLQSAWPGPAGFGCSQPAGLQQLRVCPVENKREQEMHSPQASVAISSADTTRLKAARFTFSPVSFQARRRPDGSGRVFFRPRPRLGDLSHWLGEVAPPLIHQSVGFSF